MRASLLYDKHQLTELWLRPPLTEDMSSDPPRAIFLDVEADESSFRHGENEIEVFQAASFCFLDEKENKNKGYDIKEREESE